VDALGVSIATPVSPYHKLKHPLVFFRKRRTGSKNLLLLLTSSRMSSSTQLPSAGSTAREQVTTMASSIDVELYGKCCLQRGCRCQLLVQISNSVVQVLTKKGCHQC
jgi:hypothetical protein